MRKLTFLFAALLSLSWGTMKAETITDDFTSYSATSSGQTLGSNWYVFPGDDGSYGRFGSDYTYKHNEYDGADANYVSGYSSNYNKNVWLVLTKEVSGNITFRSKMNKNSGTIYVTNKVTAVGDGTFTVDKSDAKSYSVSTTVSSNTYDSGSSATYVAFCLTSDQMRLLDVTYTEHEAISGPALVVKVGETTLTSPYAYSFGLTTAGTTKTFTLSNPGAEATPISVSATGGFGASFSDNATSIPAGDEVTLTITMPEATANGTVTVSSTADGIDDFVFNVSGTIRDANKLYEYGFTALPQDWTTTGSWYYSAANGAYTTVWYLTSNARLITPLLNVSEGETFFVEAKGYSTSNTSYQHLQMQYSADGTTWTNFDSEPTLDPSNWQTFAFTGVPAGKYHIAINASQADIRMFYGGELPVEPKMVVTQPASLDFGVITEATTKTFTIANTGLATLEGISVTSSNSSIFTVTGAPTSLAAGESAEVTITMAATTTGALSSDITVSATGMEDVQFTVTGVVLPEDMMVVDFNEGLPEKWNNVSNYWTFNNGMATGMSSYSQLITPILRFTEGNIVAIKAQCTDNDTSDYLQIYGSSDNGSTWTAYDKKINGGSNGLALNENGWGTIVLTDIPTTVTALKFVGYYVNIDEIAGLTYAPVLEVYKEGQGFASPAYHHFGECSADADVTFSFSNYGGGTITITNVTVDGSDAYSTNWTESVEVPFDLVITRTYDAERVGTSEAVITVTTSEGEFVINVDGSDKGLNAPELAVSPAEDADFGTQLQEAPKAQVYTITNTGTGTLTGTITSSDTDQFTVNASSFSLGTGESMAFEIALVYDENYGAKAATITIHPDNEGLKDVIINATASTLDPEAWIEDFAAGTLPMGWEITPGSSSGDTYAWHIGTFSNYENKTSMAIAPTSTTYNTITTPCLTAKEGDVLTWDAYFNWSDEYMTVEYSTDKSSWTKIYDEYKPEDDEVSTRYSYKAMSFTAPADGDYYLRFTSRYSNGIDNFCGFKLNLPDHIMAITASNIPTSGSYNPSMKATKSFNATVTVKETRGVDEENVVAKLYMGDEVIGTSEAVAVEAGETKQITIVATPTVAATEGAQMHIEVEYAGGTLTTEPVTRYVSEYVTLALTETEGQEITTGYSAVYDLVTLTRSFAAGWNTFVAPQAVSMSEFGEGAKAYSFTGFADGTLSFSVVTGETLSPATPYIIYVPEKIENKVFTWESPVIYSSYVGTDNIKTTKNEAIFQGTYAPIAAGEMTGKYGVTPDGHIQKAGAKASIKGFRAYFELPANVEVKALRFEDIEDAISLIQTDAEENDAIYNIAGQRVQKMQKGINIINGKKILK